MHLGMKELPLEWCLHDRIHLSKHLKRTNFTGCELLLIKLNIKKHGWNAVAGIFLCQPYLLNSLAIMHNPSQMFSSTTGFPLTAEWWGASLSPREASQGVLQFFSMKTTPWAVDSVSPVVTTGPGSWNLSWALDTVKLFFRKLLSFCAVPWSVWECLWAIVFFSDKAFIFSGVLVSRSAPSFTSVKNQAERYKNLLDTTQSEWSKKEKKNQ